MLNNELFIEHAVKKPVLGLHPYQNGVDDTPQFGKALLDGLGVAPVHGLLRVLFQPRLHLLPKGRVSCETSFEYTSHECTLRKTMAELQFLGVH